MNLVGTKPFKTSTQKWNNWQWQLHNRLSSLHDLKQYLKLSQSEIAGLKYAQETFRVSITPYVISLMEFDNPLCPIRQQVIPTINEKISHPSDLIDPLGEEPYTAVEGLIHKYPDRALYLPIDNCASYCRYCTRSRLVNRGSLKTSKHTFDNVYNYIKSTPAIRDVLITGGDPLIMNTDTLCERISKINSISHVQMIRLGTRTPTFLPQIITQQLVKQLRTAGVLYVSLHINHPRELTPQTITALNIMADGGLVMGNQSVLLKGINDKAEIIKNLNHKLLQNRVTPYYLHLCDCVKGTSHFRTSIQTGIDIIDKLRGYTTGYAVPTLALDLPNGGGKVAISSNTIIKQNGKKFILRNYQGLDWQYQEV